jgi:Cys-tRNA(Pro) deacylase
MTSAVRKLLAAKVDFKPHFYPYLDHGGTRHAAESLGVSELEVVKTLVMEAHGERRTPLLVLMHGDHEVSTKGLARHLGCKSVSPATETGVEKITGYVPGGVSPFGTRLSPPVYVEESVLALDRIYVNGGKRGFLVEIHPAELLRVLSAIPVNVGLPR